LSWRLFEFVKWHLQVDAAIFFSLPSALDSMLGEHSISCSNFSPSSVLYARLVFFAERKYTILRRPLKIPSPFAISSIGVENILTIDRINLLLAYSLDIW